MLVTQDIDKVASIFERTAMGYVRSYRAVRYNELPVDLLESRDESSQTTGIVVLMSSLGAGTQRYCCYDRLQRCVGKAGVLSIAPSSTFLLSASTANSTTSHPNPNATHPPL